MKMRQLIAATVVLAALAATLYWSNHRTPADVFPKTDASASNRIVSLTQDDITKLEINKKGGDDLVLSRTGPESWKITAPKSLLADPDPISTMLYTLSPLDASSLIQDKPTDLTEFGLADPSLKVTATVKDGKTQTVLFGDDTPTGDSTYVMLMGDPRVFSVSKNSKSGFDKGVKDIRDKRLLSVDFDKLSSLEITGPKVNLTLAPDSGHWVVRSPKDMRADKSKLDTVVQDLKGATLDPSVSDEDMKTAASSFASGAPVATVKAADASGTQELQVRKNKDLYYAKSTAVETPIKLSGSLGMDIDKNMEDFRQKKVFDFADQMPNKVEMHDGPKTYSMSRTGEDWFSGGKKMDAVTVEAFLSALRSLEATKIASSGFSSPAITIAVTSQDGKLVEKVGIAKAGTEYVAKRDDSPTLYQLTPKVVTDMQEAAAVMKPAEPVPPQK
ncbi:MAG: DUF4340 domain-containing protein [Candidatus Acidiferrales bacterium]|jgi:hypothetical protein